MSCKLRVEIWLVHSIHRSSKIAPRRLQDDVSWLEVMGNQIERPKLFECSQLPYQPATNSPRIAVQGHSGQNGQNTVHMAPEVAVTCYAPSHEHVDRGLKVFP